MPARARYSGNVRCGPRADPDFRAMRLHSLQYLRAIAALAVVHFHAVSQVPEYFDFLVEAGQWGVDLFFVISGAVMALAARHEPPGRFVARRALRVVPLYWAFTLLLVGAAVALPSALQSATVTPGALVRSLLFVPYRSEGAADPGSPQGMAPLLVPGWTLNYEMYFYALLAIALGVSPRRPLTLAAALLVGIMLGCRLSGSESASATFYGDPIALEFVFGMALGHARRTGRRLGRRTAAATCVAGAALLLCESELPRFVGSGLPAALLVAGALWLRPGRWRLALLLGDASYAIYLSHLFALGVAREALPPLLGSGPGAAAAFVLASVVLAAVVGTAVHVAVERPLLGIGRRMIERRGSVLHA